MTSGFDATDSGITETADYSNFGFNLFQKTPALEISGKTDYGPSVLAGGTLFGGGQDAGGDSVSVEAPPAMGNAFQTDAMSTADKLEGYMAASPPYVGQLPMDDGTGPRRAIAPGGVIIQAITSNRAGYLAAEITGATPDAALIDMLQSAAYSAGGQAALMAPTVAVSGRTVMAGGSARVGSRGAPAGALVHGSEYGGDVQFHGGAGWFHPTVTAWVAGLQARQASPAQVQQQLVSHDPFSTGTPLAAPEDVARQLEGVHGLEGLSADDVTIARKRFFDKMDEARSATSDEAQERSFKIFSEPGAELMMSDDPVGSHIRGPGQPKFEHQSYAEWLAGGDEQIWSDPRRGLYSHEDVMLGLSGDTPPPPDPDEADSGYLRDMTTGVSTSADTETASSESLMSDTAGLAGLFT